MDPWSTLVGSIVFRMHTYSICTPVCRALGRCTLTVTRGGPSGPTHPGVAELTALRPRVHVVQVELHTPDSPRVVTICADSRPERCTQLITDRVARVADPSSVVIRVYESVYEN